MENQDNIINEKDISNGLLMIAIDECGLIPLVCACCCVIIGAGIGGLIGYTVFIDTRK